jgi:hypothetical protein
MKNCEHCGHSRAAHIDGIRCALCGCLPARQTFVQTKLAFRSSLPNRAVPNSRKR